MRREKRELCKSLESAGKYMLALGNAPTWASEFASSEDLGRFIMSCRAAILSGKITPQQRRKLWTAFAPTCDWDDSGGDVELGNRVFELLDKIYGGEIKASSKPPIDRRISPTGTIATTPLEGMSLEEPIKVKLRVISDYGSTERLVTEQATPGDVEDVMAGLDWHEFHQVVLERPNGDWLEVGGNLEGDGLSAMFEERGDHFVIEEPPTTVDQMTSILLGYLSNTDTWLKSTEWS